MDVDRIEFDRENKTEFGNKDKEAAINRLSVWERTQLITPCGPYNTPATLGTISSPPYTPCNKEEQLMKGGHPRFNELLVQMSIIHAKKNHDYALNHPLENFKECEDIGIPAWKGVWIRMSDKWSRVKCIIKKRERLVKEEFLTDTLMDLANYALLTLILLEESESATQAEKEKC